MPRIVSILLVVVGIILLIMGISEMDSFASRFSKFFTGSPTDRAVWLTIGGAVAIIVGGGLGIRSWRSPD
jgi:hypothetical protein